MKTAVLILLTCCLAQAGEAAWPGPVPGHVPVQPDEHPRLFFRQADLPALRERMKTPEGQAILRRLRFLLNGGDGESLPPTFNPGPAVNQGPKGWKIEPGGIFTHWHAAGYGLLYQLTGEKRYADLAAQCMIKTLEGQPDRDERYTFTEPGTGFRAGTIFGAIGLGYDLNHDAWDEALRKRVCEALCTYRAETAKLDTHGKPAKKRQTYTVESLSKGGGYPVTSNHSGNYLGGTGLGLLAIRGDRCADAAVVEKCLKNIIDRMPAQLGQGFGDHGWYAEGTHPGRTCATGGLLEFLISLRNTAGVDFITSRTNVPWQTLRLAMEIVPINGQPNIPHVGVYGTDILYEWRYQISHNGEFALGFAIVAPAQRPALRWIYDSFVAPAEQDTYNAWLYPHRAVHAFVNWPIGEESVDPDEVLPHAILDRTFGYFVARNRWQDGNDIVVNGLLGGGPLGYHKLFQSKIGVIAEGKIVRLPLAGEAPAFESQKVVCYRAARDGTTIITGASKSGQFCQVAVDFSQSSGADLLLAVTGSMAGHYADHQVKVAGTTVDLFTIPAAVAKTAKVEGDAIVVGKQRITLGEAAFELETMGKVVDEVAVQHLDLLQVAQGK